jgi:two-component system copper resistance phosphate regulon response regulator CusR
MRILLVEDEEKVLRFVSHGLRAEGFAVDEATDGKQGLDLATSYQYDLLILDIMLPQMSGTEILRQIRNRGQLTPVLMLSARDQINDKVSHLEFGADDYLTKPFSFTELQARVKALIRRGHHDLSSRIQIADLEIDRLAHQVKRAGKRINLSAKEYALLEYFAINTGRALSRTMIIEHVWDQSFEGLTNIVDVYVKQIRHKIDEDHMQKLIHTVRGIGYRLGDES